MSYIQLFPLVLPGSNRLKNFFLLYFFLGRFFKNIQAPAEAVRTCFFFYNAFLEFRAQDTWTFQISGSVTRYCLTRPFLETCTQLHKISNLPDCIVNVI